MAQLRQNLLGLSFVEWIDSRKYTTRNRTMYSPGNDDNTLWYGVNMIDKNTNKLADEPRR